MLANVFIGHIRTGGFGMGPDDWFLDECEDEHEDEEVFWRKI